MAAIDNDMGQIAYCYTTEDGGKVLITEDQAWEIEQQCLQRHYAEDLLETIHERYNGVKTLSHLAVVDLYPYTGALEEQLELYDDETALEAACDGVIEDIIIQKQREKEGGKLDDGISENL